MTIQKINEIAQAWAGVQAGEKWEYRCKTAKFSHDWKEINLVSGWDDACESCEFRRKPTPKLRVWKPGEAIGMRVRSKYFSDTHRMVGTTSSEGIWFCGVDHSITYEKLLSEWVQLDGSPCGVMEDVQ